MSKESRICLLAATTVACVIPVGLSARCYRPGADPATLLGFLATYLGDTLWPVMFYFIGRFCFPNAPARKLIVATLAITLTLEFSQLWKPTTLQWLRQQPIIGFILGNHFIWSDVVCCVTGTLLAWLIDSLLVARLPISK
jgi:glycopeptide antibiotics resistance protein